MKDLVFDLQRFDNIINTASHTLLSGTAGNDTIMNGGTWANSYHNGGSCVTIEAGAGNDFVDNYGDPRVIINADDGDDTISSGGIHTTIYGGAGNDSIHSAGYESMVDGGIEQFTEIKTKSIMFAKKWRK